MTAHTVKRIDDMEAIFGGGFRRARAELGVESFGMQIIDMPPDYKRYPTHDHEGDGQEEVFVALRGGGEIEIDGERHPLDADHVARVAPTAKRKVLPGAEGIRLLVIGGVPGQPYVAPEITELGVPDPTAAK